MKEALLVTKLVPLPANDGGKQRTLAVVRRLARRTRLTVVGFNDGTADPDGLRSEGIDVVALPWHPTPPRALAGALRTGSLTAGRFWSKALRDAVVQAARGRQLDLLQVEYLQMAPAAAGITARRRVLDLHNVESALVRSYARRGRGPAAWAAAAEAVLLERLERRLLPGFDLVATVSGHERDRLPAHLSPVVVCPNGWDPTPDPPPVTGEPVVAFVAAMGWAPNVDAAVWFAGRVWPLVLARHPQARLLLVGRDPATAVRALASGSIEVSGTVESVRPYLGRALVTVAPLRSGGGTRLKILESLDAQRPVVATSLGVDGLEDLVGQGVLLADDERTMADHLVELLARPEDAHRLGRAGRQAVATSHGWDASLAPLFEAVWP